MPRIAAAVVLVTCVLAAPLVGQTPQPFPRPGAQPPAAPAPPPASAPRSAVPAQSVPAATGVPDVAALGIPVYPSAEFLASYDAGRQQRYYLFGTTTSFAEIVGYYQALLDERGDAVFRDPPTHMFSGDPLPDYREETMAFPPSVTVKDFSSGGSAGYPNPKLGAQPVRFPTIIMIVPAPPGTPR